MEKCKYIMFEADGAPLAIVFPNFLNHKKTAGSLLPQLHMLFNEAKIVSAGFYNDYSGAFGDSESLKLKSRPEDTEIIKKMLGDNK